MEVRRNPLLAIVGNPPGRDVHPLAFEARDRYREDMGAGHTAAAEYWRGQAGAFFTQNPPLSRMDLEVLAEAEAKLASRTRRARRNPVAGEVSCGSLDRGGKKAARKRKAKSNPQDKKKSPPKTKQMSLEEAARKFEGFDAALKAYKRFHGTKPSHVVVYELPDGSGDVRVEAVHAALHKTLETPYVVPWESNKKGNLWLHEHPEDGAPLEILHPATGTTRKIGGQFVVDDWWYS